MGDMGVKKSINMGDMGVNKSEFVFLNIPKNKHRKYYIIIHNLFKNDLKKKILKCIIKFIIKISKL